MAIDKKLIDQLLTDYKKPEDIIGENGLLKELTKAILERALQAEMTDHLGYEEFMQSKLSRTNGIASLFVPSEVRAISCRPRFVTMCTPSLQIAWIQHIERSVLR